MSTCLNAAHPKREKMPAGSNSKVFASPSGAIIIPMPLGLYISVPFCRSKCTYCNFASDVFSRGMFEKYIARLCDEIAQADETAQRMGTLLDGTVNTVYFGGGTPTLLDVSQLDRVFVNIRQKFEVAAGCEITVECAPGTLSQATIECFARNGVNRVSLGVQSFVDQEARSVGRLHNRETVLNDIAQLRSAGISNITVDLIAGLPHQTLGSWELSLDTLLDTGVPHASVYMLEVDEDSRLGRELIAGGQKYHAHFVPDEELTADMYEIACERLNAAGIEQYEISNFARPGFESKHNLKYWTRQPYLGFGVDAHSMLLARLASSVNADQEHDLPGRSADEKINAIRFCNADSLTSYLENSKPQPTIVTQESALEETCFLGLRLTRGLDLCEVAKQFGDGALAVISEIIADSLRSGLMERRGDFVRLTSKGRLLSNEVFERFVSMVPG
jgi:oxygen-independent coproporphyrinogen III oxidase